MKKSLIIILILFIIPIISFGQRVTYKSAYAFMKKRSNDINQKLLKGHNKEFEGTKTYLFFTVPKDENGMACISLITENKLEVLVVDCKSFSTKTYDWDLNGGPPLYPSDIDEEEDRKLISDFNQETFKNPEERWDQYLMTLNNIKSRNTDYYRRFNDTYLKQYDKDLKISNDKIKIVSDKIASNNNIIDDEIVKEFESIKSKLVLIPQVYNDYLENLKSENEKRKNNLIFEELVNITESKFNNSKEVATDLYYSSIDSIYKELNEEYKLKYINFINLNYLNKKETLNLSFLSKSWVKENIQFYKDEGYIDNSLIVFEGKISNDFIGDMSGFIDLGFRKERLNEVPYEYKIEVGRGLIDYSFDEGLFSSEIQITSIPLRNFDCCPTKNEKYFSKKPLKKIKNSGGIEINSEILPIVININNFNGESNPKMREHLLEIREVLNNAKKKVFLSQYSNDKDLLRKEKNIKDFLFVLPFQDTMIFYSSTVKQSKKNKPSITFQGWDLYIGKKLYIKTKDGNIPIPDGKYKLEDKNRIVTKSGVIKEFNGVSLGDTVLLSEKDLIDGTIPFKHKFYFQK